MAPRWGIRHWRSPNRVGLWWQELYVDPASGLLCRTDRLPEEKARLRARRNRVRPPIERIVLADHRELRLLDGLWYEVQLADLPEPVYRAVRETKRLPLNRWGRGPCIEIETYVRRLISPPVRDVASGRLVELGPPIDDAEHWKRYRRERPVRRYAVAKRTLSRRELRRHGIRNLISEY